MPYDFDTVRPRLGMGAEKWEEALANGCPQNVVPLTVADMEFKTAPEIVAAVIKAAEGGMWGYSRPTDEYKAAAQKWMQAHHGWDAKPEWMVNTPGVVPAMYAAVRAFTSRGEAVLVQPPCYPPFMYSAQNAGRQVAENPLIKTENGYQIDFADLAKKAKTAKIMLFCSPHNPVGRVWQRQDVERVAQICKENGTVLFCDEIHCDILMPGQKHFSAGCLPENLLENIIIATSACKSFSLAGEPCSNIYIPNEALRKKYEEQIENDAIGTESYFGMAATQAGYTHGGQWLDEMNAYVYQNYLFVKNFLAENLPQVTAEKLEGTYLAWLNFAALGLEDAALHNFLEKEADVYLSHGTNFGTGGSGFMRVNLACPRAALEDSFKRLAAQAKKRGYTLK